MNIIWFVAKRDNKGKIIHVQDDLNREQAEIAAAAMNGADPDPHFVIVHRFSKKTVRMDRYTIHWRRIKEGSKA